MYVYCVYLCITYTYCYFRIIGTPPSKHWPSQTQVVPEQFIVYTKQPWSRIVPQMGSSAQILLSVSFFVILCLSLSMLLYFSLTVVTIFSYNYSGLIKRVLVIVITVDYIVTCRV